jgi:diguanylate cyclase
LGQGEPYTESARLFGDVLARLEELQRTPVGTVIHDQIARVIDEHCLVSSRIEQAYGVLLHMLLDAYARDPRADEVIRLTSELIRHRSSLSSEPNVATRSPDDAPSDAGVVARSAGAADDPSGTVESPPPGEASDRSDRSFWSFNPDSAGVPVSSQSERRVNASYRLHLDRKRDEIERLQETLARSVDEAVAQNREFGALLETELSALHGAEGGEEIEQLRSILICGLEELIQGQRTLGIKLRRTDDYLRLVRSDSDNLRDELNKVRLLSLTDESTGLPNRRAFMRRLQDEIGRVQRYGAPLAVALIDLDEFKNVNDRYGHAGGDAVLACYATSVLTVLRHHDMVARYGGEEFAVLLPNTTVEGAAAALAKVRARAAEARCDFEGRSLPLPTFSVGLTFYVAGESPASVIERADRALYRAKNAGRDRLEYEAGVVPAATIPESGQGNGS